ncbi:MAG: hypothetical protein AAFY36_11060, partial [Bacteroidota bacterium]
LTIQSCSMNEPYCSLSFPLPEIVEHNSVLSILLPYEELDTMVFMNEEGDLLEFVKIHSLDIDSLIDLGSQNCPSGGSTEVAYTVEKKEYWYRDVNGEYTINIKYWADISSNLTPGVIYGGVPGYAISDYLEIVSSLSGLNCAPTVFSEQLMTRNPGMLRYGRESGYVRLGVQYNGRIMRFNAIRNEELVHSEGDGIIGMNICDESFVRIF